MYNGRYMFLNLGHEVHKLVTRQVISVMPHNVSDSSFIDMDHH